jgi:uncharacterized membrane protein
MKNSRTHYWGLGVIVGIAIILRFWNLDLKPLWLDEVITALFTLGHTYDDIPVNTLFPLGWVNTLFSWQAGSTCASVTAAIRAQSTHPPLFFCLMHQWLALSQSNSHTLLWHLRSLPALAGVANVVAVYVLGRLAFSPAAGLMTAALMAVSPFAVYLSQEARHYTLPMLATSLALVACIRIQQDLYENKSINSWTWGGWIAINSLGFYIHYFFLLVFVAQCLTLVGLAIGQRTAIARNHWLLLGLAIAAVTLTYLPWMPQLWEHIHQPATEWAQVKDTDWTAALAALLRSMAGWIVMLIVLPVENQPLFPRRVLGLLTFAIAVWCFGQAIGGLKALWKNTETRLMVLTLGGVILCITLEYLVGIYGLGKDVSRAFRYNFTFYPAAVTLLGASFATLPVVHSKHESAGHSTLPIHGFRFPHLAHSLSTQGIVLGIGLLSSWFVISGLAFYKPYYPDQVVQRVRLNAETPLVVMQDYNSSQDLAFGLSLALALQQQHPQTASDPNKVYWSFVSTGNLQTAPLWQSSQGQKLIAHPFDLWRVSDRQYVPWNLINFIPMSTIKPIVGESIQPFLIKSAVGRANQATCALTPHPYEYLGTQYHQYQCVPSNRNEGMSHQK